MTIPIGIGSIVVLKSRPNTFRYKVTAFSNSNPLDQDPTLTLKNMSNDNDFITAQLSEVSEYTAGGRKHRKSKRRTMRKKRHTGRRRK